MSLVLKLKNSLDITNKNMVGKCLLVFAVCNIFSLSIFASNHLPDSIKRYYYFVNLAEISLIDSLYDQATLYYDSAFSQKNYPFAADKYNAAVCHVYLRQYEQSFPLFKEIIQKGYGISALMGKNVFEDFFSSQWGLALKDYSENIELTFNRDLRRTIDSLFYMDQFFRKNREFGNPYDFFEDTINRIDDSNRNVLEAIIERYGFPGEEIIGLSDSSLTLQPYYTMLLHFQQISTGRRRGEVQNVSPWIVGAYYSGRMNVHEAANLLESAGQDLGSMAATLVRFILTSPGSGYVEVDGKWTYEGAEVPYGFFRTEGEYAERLNRLREEFGLESVNDFRKKVIFRRNNEVFDFSKIKGSMNTFLTSEINSMPNPMNIIPLEE
jgi:hypothetical protein